MNQPDDLTGAWASEPPIGCLLPADPAGHDDGPSVQECAEADRHWPLQKAGE